MPTTHESVKQQCPYGHTQFYFSADGITYKCRHCREVFSVSWAVIQQQHARFVFDGRKQAQPVTAYYEEA